MNPTWPEPSAATPVAVCSALSPNFWAQTAFPVVGSRRTMMASAPPVLVSVTAAAPEAPPKSTLLLPGSLPGNRLFARKRLPSLSPDNPPGDVGRNFISLAHPGLGQVGPDGPSGGTSRCARSGPPESDRSAGRSRGSSPEVSRTVSVGRAAGAPGAEPCG